MPGNYGNYGNYGQPYTFGAPTFPQNGTAVVQPAQQQNNAGSIMTIFVSSEEEVNNYPVAAGLTVLLISFNLKKFWLKTTDTSGVPQQPRSFSFEEKTPITNQNGSFVTKAEFDSLNKKLDKLIADLGGAAHE